MSRLVAGEALPFESVAFEKGLVLHTDIASSIHMDGNSTQLKQLTSILLDNGTRHSASGGEGRLTLTREHGMAQTFSDSEQGVIAVQVGSQGTGTQIILQDKNGNTVLSRTPEDSFAVVILSCPEMVKGETYTITVGTQNGSFAAS